MYSEIFLWLSGFSFGAAFVVMMVNWMYLVYKVVTWYAEWRDLFGGRKSLRETVPTKESQPESTAGSTASP